MQKVIPLIVLTLLAGAIYTAYGVYSYTPKELDPPQFDVESPDAQAVRRSIEGDESELELSEELESRKERIVARIRPTLKRYKTFVENAPQPASRTLQASYQLMRNSRLPVFFPDIAAPESRGTLKFSELALGQANAGRVRRQNRRNLECSAAQGNAYNILVGSGIDNKLSCDVAPVTQGDVRIYIAGPGDDEIEDRRGHTIVNAGSGDDIVTTGPGSAIVYVETGWGRDTLNVSCDKAKLDPERFPEQMPAPWKFKYANFIVFAPGIAPEDIAYKDGVVRHRDTDDKLILEQNCFSYIFVEDLRSL